MQESAKEGIKIFSYYDIAKEQLKNKKKFKYYDQQNQRHNR